MKRSLFVLGLLASISALPHAAAAADENQGASAKLDHKPVDFAADHLTYNRDGDVVIADGNIVLTHKGLVFHADRATYNRKTGIVHVEGDLWARDSDGNVLTADSMDLKDNFDEGLIENIGLILSDNSRFAARSAVRREDGRTTLAHAVYSPCKVCKDDPTPVWRIPRRQGDSRPEQEAHLL